MRIGPKVLGGGAVANQWGEDWSVELAEGSWRRKDVAVGKKRGNCHSILGNPNLWLLNSLFEGAGMNKQKFYWTLLCVNRLCGLSQNGSYPYPATHLQLGYPLTGFTPLNGLWDLQV